MPTYWDRLAQTYTAIGDADFWLRQRLRLIEGLSGRVLEACCGGGRLVVELLQRGVDAYGIDLSPRMIGLARSKLTRAGFDPGRVCVASVTALPFGEGGFDAVLSTGAIGLFKSVVQQAALKEMARVAGREVRLLEAFEKKKGWYGGRVWALMFDGMRPIPGEFFDQSGLDYRPQWATLGSAFSYIHCTKRGASE